jgi:hypothetical protein
MPGPRDEAAFAANWRTVLLADALLGMVVLAGGLVAMVLGHPLAFVAVIAGAVYVGLVGRRYRRWKGLRRQSDSSAG